MKTDFKTLHDSSIVLDAHVDTLLRVLDRNIDLGPRNNTIYLDIPRLREGGVNIQFFAVWVDPNKFPLEKGIKRANDLIQSLHQQMAKYPDELEFAMDIPTAKQIVEKGKIAAMLGLEGGHIINHSLDVLRMFRHQGARYLTLSWLYSNDIADSADDKPIWNGLSPFGRKVIQEMNKIGMVVDASHISERAVLQSLEISAKPIAITHSGCRAIMDNVRNVSDEILQKLAKNNGIIGIMFYTKFLTYAETPTIEHVLDQIEHVVKIAGINHVGLGSDFDGASLYPVGLEDCSKYPAITDGLVKRGYSDEDIKKILGENFMRVFSQSE